MFQVGPGYPIFTLPPAPSPRDGWFPTFVGMVKRRKGNQFGEGVYFEEGSATLRQAQDKPS